MANEELTIEATDVTQDSGDNGLPVEGQQPSNDTIASTAPEPQTQTQQTPPQAVPQDGNPQWWKPDLFKLKYRGSEVSPKDYKHATDLMQKGYSYDQAMAQVKQQKQEIETERQRLKKYAELDEAFTKNPAFAARIQQYYNETVGQQQQPQVQGQQYAPMDPQVLRQLQELNQWRQQQTESAEDAKVKNEINELRTANPSIQWDAVTETGHTFLYDVLNHAHQNGFPSLRAAFRDYTYDNVASTTKMQTAQQISQQRQQQARQGVVGNAAPKPAGGAPVNTSGMNYDDITAMIKRERGLT